MNYFLYLTCKMYTYTFNNFSVTGFDDYSSAYILYHVMVSSKSEAYHWLFESTEDGACSYHLITTMKSAKSYFSDNSSQDDTNYVGCIESPRQISWSVKTRGKRKLITNKTANIRR
jgi:hypothetical protein